MSLLFRLAPGDGSFYRAHRDNPKHGHELEEVGLVNWLRFKPYRDRGLTAIIYLNAPEYNIEDGGLLSLFPGADIDDEEGKEEDEIKVVPDGGTLLLFDSRKMLHKVNPSFCRRIAMTLWIEGSEGKA